MKINLYYGIGGYLMVIIKSSMMFCDLIKVIYDGDASRFWKYSVKKAATSVCLPYQIFAATSSNQSY